MAKTVVGGSGKGPSKKRVTQVGSVVASGTGGVKHLNNQDLLTGFLVSFSTNQNGDDYRINMGANFIGSDGDKCSIILTDPGISGVHANIKSVPSGDTIHYQIIVESSSSLLKINGETIFDKALLKNLDKIGIGGHELLFISINCGEYNLTVNPSLEQANQDSKKVTTGVNLNPNSTRVSE